MLVSFCKENLCSEQVIKMLEKKGDEYEIRINKCIGVCDKCTHKYICRVDGKFLEADTAQELYDMIVNFKKDSI
ncbi:Uncharacterized protein YuzB, UPF0349 family [Hathewaya proteolytica DSM 3090]|uniref:Uncharacterized protein YuzB, UPF0349 family n=1 Tax=Hathewaya proteolytica DSM 3090 TaxID=1121331 RepID=A0A1M6Q3T4_9CLOT|nr:DUF1450 domain-containing protein [Hathewaya proteolytica]SHK14914.1 Uncharacterized protein YuzB, UPF0349 family [Hathewaya proteolytica DSM 3090]